MKRNNKCQNILLLHRDSCQTLTPTGLHSRQYMYIHIYIYSYKSYGVSKAGGSIMGGFLWEKLIKSRNLRIGSFKRLMFIYYKSEGIREVESSKKCENEGTAAPHASFSYFLARFNFSNPFGFVINEHKCSKVLISQISRFSQPHENLPL